MNELERLAALYLTGRRDRGEIVQQTYRQYQSSLLGKRGLCEAHGARPVRQVGPATIDRWLRIIAPDKPSTRASKHTAVSAFTAWLTERGHIRQDPCLDLPAPRRPRTEPRALPEDAIARLLHVAPDARARAIIWLEVGLGLRRIEVHRLNVEDWLRRDDVLRVTGKGGHEREVPVIAHVRWALTAYLAEAPASVGPMIRSTTRAAGRLALSTLSQYMARWMYAAGIKAGPRDGVSMHALRHTAASDVLDRSGDLRVVQEMLGHVRLDTTAIYLRRAGRARLREAMEGRTYELDEAA